MRNGDNEGDSDSSESEEVSAPEPSERLSEETVEEEPLETTPTAAKKSEELLKRLKKLGVSLEKLEDLIAVAEGMSSGKFTKRELVAASTKLLGLEKEHNAPYKKILSDFDKKAKERARLEKTIQDLKFKHQRLEEELSIYLKQHELTLERIGKISKVNSLLKEHGIDLNDAERLASLLSTLKELGFNATEVADFIAKTGSFKTAHAELEKKIADAEEGLEKLSSQRSELEDEISRLLVTKPQAQEIMAELERLRNQKKRLDEEVDRSDKHLRELSSELETFLEAKPQAEKVSEQINERKQRLEELEAKLDDARIEFENLGEDLNMTKAFLSYLTDPNTATTEEINSIIQQLTNVVKARQGELPTLKPLEGQIGEKVRRRLVDLVIPVVRPDMVPKWAFEKLEKEYRELQDKRDQLLRDTESLRKTLRTMESAPPPQPPRPTERPVEAKPAPSEEVKYLMAESTGVAVPSSPSVRRIRIQCPSCKNTTPVWLPERKELEELDDKGTRLKLDCPHCTRTIPIDPKIILPYAG